MMGKRAKPTKAHRLAIVPGILGTVYGVNKDGEARYFDYDLAGAMEFAGPGTDPRWSVPPRPAAYVTSGEVHANPGPRTRCLWIKPQTLSQAEVDSAYRWADAFMAEHMVKPPDGPYQNECHCPPGQCICLQIPGQVERVEPTEEG